MSDGKGVFDWNSHQLYSRIEQLEFEGKKLRTQLAQAEASCERLTSRLRIISEQLFAEQGDDIDHQKILDLLSEPTSTALSDYISKKDLEQVREALGKVPIIASAAKVPSGTKDWNEGFWCAQKQITQLLTEHINKALAILTQLGKPTASKP